MKRLRYDKVIFITVLMAVLSMAVALLVLARIKNQLVNVIGEEYKKQQTLLAKQVAETLKNNIVNVQNQLRVMATMPEVKNIDDPAACNTRLEELLRVNQKQLGNLARTDPTGRFVCSVNKAIIGQDGAQYGKYITDLVEDPTHQPVLSRVTKPAGADTFAAGMHVPVFDGDTFRGSLGGALYFKHFQDAYLQDIKFGQNGFIVVLDDNGDILYHPSAKFNGKNLLDPAVLSLFEPQANMRELVSNINQGKSGTFDYSLEGTSKVGLYQAFKIPDIQRHWGVVVTIPVEDLEHVVSQAGINRILMVLVLLFSFTIALLTFVSLRIIIKNREIQRMKDDFISITSHQLRTPATIVKQNLGLIKGGYATRQKDTDKFIEAAYVSNEDQLSIIENILSVSKLEAGRLVLEKESFALEDLVNKVAGTMKANLTAKKHTLSINMPKKAIRLNADPTKMAMIIENLISNAIKYTDRRGTIAIKARTRKGMTIITFQDNGRGISKQDMQKLFLRFNRLHSATASHVPGTGLGLYLTKKLIELHGGKITVDSHENQGTTFTIILPLN